MINPQSYANRTVERAIRVLRENGLIERTGSDKRGRWIPTRRG